MAAPGFIEMVKGAAADLANAAAGAIRIFMDVATGEPSYKDESGTVVSLVGAPGTPGAPGDDGADAPPLTYDPHGTGTGSTETIDVSADDVHRLLLDAATVTVTITGWPASGTYQINRVKVKQDGTGGRDLVLGGAEVTWGDAGEPDWTAMGPGESLIVTLETEDGGTTVVATVAGRAGPAGAAGTDGVDGVDGSVGGAISIDYTFSTTTTDSDPGSGNLRLSNATQASAVTLRADLLDAHGVDWTAVLDTLADASNTVKGHIRLFKKSDPTKWLLATVSAVATPSGYRNITIANVGSSGANPLANGDAITLAFSRSGDQGSTVGAGTLTTIEELDGSPTDSAVTKLVVPNGYLAIASHVATLTFPAGSSYAFKRTHRVNGGNLSTTSTTKTPIDATNLAYLIFDLAVGDVVRCSIEGQFWRDSGGIFAVDFEVDQPTSSNVYVGGDYGVFEHYSDTNRKTFTPTGYFTATEAGTHGFRPVWFTEASTLRLRNGASGNDGQPIFFVVEKLGAPAA